MTSPLDFSGKRILVVGGSSGIGNGIAQAFRGCGGEVHVWGTRASADDYSAEDGSDLSGLSYAQVDVGDMAAIAAWTPPFERLDVLVLSQGTVLYRRAEFEDDGFAKVIEVNLNSLMACARKFQPMLAAAKGSIITISSKAGAVALTRTLGQAWAGDGIRVNGVAPGLVATKLTRVTTDSPERLSAALKTIPMGRLGEPSEMAGATLFLASPLASYVCGQTSSVDGGLTL